MLSRYRFIDWQREKKMEKIIAFALHFLQWFFSWYEVAKVGAGKIWEWTLAALYPANKFMLKLNDLNTRNKFEIFSKSTIKTAKRRQRLRCVSLLLILNIFHINFYCFCFWLWTSKCFFELRWITSHLIYCTILVALVIFLWCLKVFLF